MAWEDIGENLGDKIYKLEKTIEDLRENSYNAQYNSQETYGLDIMSETDSPDSTSSFSSILRGPITLQSHVQTRIHNEAYDGSTLNDSIIASSPYIIVKPKTTENPITIKWILSAMHDGQIVVLEPFYKWAGSSNTTAYSLQLQTGGNINISSNITVNRNEKIMLQWTENVPYYSGSTLHSSSTSGSWTVLSSPQSSSSWVDTATSPLSMDGNAIYFDLKLNGSGNKKSILHNGNNLNYTVDVNGGAHNFYVDDLSSPKVGITETKLESNIPLDMNLNYVEFQEISTPSTVSANHGLIYAKDVGGVTTPMWKHSGGETSLLSTGGGSTSFVGFTADDDLSMGTYNIDGVDQLLFSTATSSDSPNWDTDDYGLEIEGGTTPTALDIRVPTGKFVNIKVAGQTEFEFKGNELDVNDNDLCNVGTIFTDYIATSSGNSNIRSYGHLDPSSDDTYDLGDTSLYWRKIRASDYIYLKGTFVFNGSNNNTFIEQDSGGLTFEVPSNDTFEFQVNSNKIIEIENDGLELASTSSKNRVIHGDSNTAGSKIGFHVGNSTNVGTYGTVEVPYVNITTYSANLDTFFGNQNGSVGVQRNNDTGYTYFSVRSGGVWKSAFMA